MFENLIIQTTPRQHPRCGYFFVTINEIPDAFGGRKKWQMFFENEDFMPISLEIQDKIFAYRNTRNICIDILMQLILESESKKLNTGVYEFTL